MGYFLGCNGGKGLVVHASEAKGTQPTGGVGPRIAVGVIGVQSLSVPDSKNDESAEEK